MRGYQGLLIIYHHFVSAIFVNTFSTVFVRNDLG